MKNDDEVWLITVFSRSLVIKLLSSNFDLQSRVGPNSRPNCSYGWGRVS